MTGPDQTDQAHQPAANPDSDADASETVDDALARARTALEESRATAQRVLDRLAAQRLPQPNDLERLAALSAVFADAAAALLPDHSDPSLPELEAAAARHARDQRQALQGVSRLTGPTTLGELIADARAGAATLLATPTWDAVATDLATGLSALAEMVDLPSGAGVQRVIELDDLARSHLPPELIPLVVTAGRGQLGFAQPAPTDASQQVQVAQPARPGDRADTTSAASTQRDTASADTAHSAVASPTATPPVTGSTLTAPMTEPTVRTGSTVVEQQSHRTATPIATETADEDDQTRLADRFGRLLAERRFGLAYWVATAAGHSNGRRRVLRAAALIDVTRQPTGACAAALRGALDGVGRKELEGDRPAQIIALTGALRAALISPYSETASVITDLVEAFSDLPELAEVANAIHQAALRGLVFGADVLTSVSDLAEAERAVHDTCTAAAAMLTRPRHFTFPRATLIWQRWVTPDGLVGALLTPAAGDDRPQRDSVATAIVRLRSRSELERTIDMIDSQLRSHGSRRLEGPVRRNLASAAGEALSIASAWVEAVTALERHREQATGPTWQHKLLDQVRTTVHERHEAIRTQVEALTDDTSAELAGAAHAALASLRETFALLDGTPLPGVEWPPALAVNRELAKVAGLRLNADLEPQGVDVDSLLDAADRDWIDAFNDRSAAGDHLVTNHVLAILQRRV
jgi:hypothetical protein